MLWDETFWEDFERTMRELRKQIALMTTPIATKELFEPFADVVEEDGKLRIDIDLPGIQKEDIQILATETSLEVRAARKEEKAERGKTFYRHERFAKSFYKAMTLPAKIDPTKISAEYKDGVLRIEAPLKEKEKEEKKIKVKVK
ncbi:MAG: Hsp20/alpha crystallin family protein [Candidatus Nanoarchaeia archaeon]